MPPPRRIVEALGRGVELGDLFAFLYLLVFVRQYMWLVADRRLAWALTLLLSALLWGAHVYAKGGVAQRTPRAFWPLVALPLLAVYALKFALPDISFDVLNHRLIQSERGLGGAQFLPGDFFPTIFPFNPASDMLTGVSRHLLGYRLGTIVNYLALLYAGTVLEKILRPFVRGAWWRCLGVLAILFTEHVLFEINNYMVDLLALPLLLEATRLALGYGETARPARDLCYGALYLGACLALKLTNVVAVVPIAALFAYGLFARPDGPRLRVAARALAAAGVGLLPLVPHAAYIYLRTRSPVFPLYNTLFKSPLWPQLNMADGRWGPEGLRETLLWPVLMFFKPERLAELPVYSGRLTFGFLLALVCLCAPGLGRPARLVSGVLLLGSLLWSASVGYIRYALYLELLGGVLVIHLAGLLAAGGRPATRPLRFAALALLAVALSAQVAAAARHAYDYEWSMRPAFFERREAHRKDVRFVLRDRSLTAFLSPENRALVGEVGAWVVSSDKTNGLEVLLRGDVPMLSVNTLPYFDMPESRRRFARAVSEARGRRMFSLCPPEELPAALELIKRRGLRAGQVTPFEVPFYSRQTYFRMVLVEVEPAPKPPAAKGGGVTEINSPLGDDAFNAVVSAHGAPARLRAGEQASVEVTVRNASDHLWPSRGQPGGKYFLNVGDIWFDAGTGELVNSLDGRTTIPHDLGPGEEVRLSLSIKAPAAPGEYVLEVDVVQEGVAWFKDRGSTPLRLGVRVE